jgi:hypothetical protein
MDPEETPLRTSARDALNEKISAATDAAHEPTSDGSPVKPRSTSWNMRRKLAFPPLSGISAGLIVLLIAALFSGNKNPVVRISSPRQGAAVPQAEGFIASGTSSGLGNDTLWLADYDGGYTIDNEATLNANGSWAVYDSDLGNTGQSPPFFLTARVIVADAQCATKLQATLNSSPDYLTGLPGGCVVAGAVTVNVSK